MCHSPHAELILDTQATSSILERRLQLFVVSALDPAHRTEGHAMNAIETDPLQDSSEKLESALAASTGVDAGEWLDDLSTVLAELWRSLVKHESGSESSRRITTIGSTDRETVPLLDRRVQQLRLEHVLLFDNTRALMQRVDDLRKLLQAGARSPAQTTDMAAVRKMAADLLELVRDHREAESKLMLESLTTDVGVGD
jgi:hypothetical protein